jgi:hypothetical protein
MGHDSAHADRQAQTNGNIRTLKASGRCGAICNRVPIMGATLAALAVIGGLLTPLSASIAFHPLLEIHASSFQGSAAFVGILFCQLR